MPTGDLTADHLRASHTGESALVLGNGPSRLRIDPYRAAVDCMTIGCNAIVRDFPDCDYVCANDRGMIQDWQIIKSTFPRAYIYGGAHDYNKLITHPDGSSSPVLRWRYGFKPGSGTMFTGALALCFAMWCGFDPIYLCGFDFGTGNVYENTPHYPKRSKPIPNWVYAMFPIWVDQMREEMRYDPMIYQLSPPYTFRMFATGVEIPDAWRIDGETAEG